MNIKEIAILENEVILESEEECSAYAEHAEFAIGMISSFAKVKLPEGLIFSLFLNQVQKHAMLSLLSALRRHHVQATLDLRFAIEAGCWAAFALAHYETESFAELGKANFIDPNPKLKSEMYEWIQKNYTPGSDSLKGFKNQLNALSTHANIVDCWRNFHDETLTHDFFDKFEEHHIKTDVWAVANLCRGLIDLFYGVNKDYNILTISADFMVNFKKMEFDNNKFKAEMMAHPNLAKYNTAI